MIISRQLADHDFGSDCQVCRHLTIVLPSGQKNAFCYLYSGLKYRTRNGWRLPEYKYAKITLIFINIDIIFIHYGQNRCSVHTYTAQRRPHFDIRFVIPSGPVTRDRALAFRGPSKQREDHWFHRCFDENPPGDPRPGLCCRELHSS